MEDMYLKMLMEQLIEIIIHFQVRYYLKNVLNYMMK